MSELRKPKLREYTEYFAKNQALPASAALAAGNGACSLNKGFTQNALNITICAQGAATVAELSVQLLHSQSEGGPYAAIASLYKYAPPAPVNFNDGEMICSFPLYDDPANGEIAPWIKAGFAGAGGNSGNFDAFIEYVAR